MTNTRLLAQLEPLQTTQYFPTDYDTARSRFINTATILQQSLPHAQRSKLCVPSRQFEDLTIDCLSIPPEGAPEKLIVVTSGIHGAEGQTGSALIELFLREKLRDLRAPGVGFVFIHAVNPFGYRTFQRTTESNVDLNRNFVLNPAQFESENKNYRRFAPVLLPEGSEGWSHFDWVRRRTAFVTRTARMLLRARLAKIPVAQLGTAVAQGQYEDPKGIFFGGKTYEPQKQLLEDLLKPLVTQYQRHLFLDVHAGAGAIGLNFITGPSTDKRLFPARHAALMRLAGRNADGSAGGSNSADKGYLLCTSETPGLYATQGDIIDYLASLCPEGSIPVGATVEFGTLGASLAGRADSLSRLISENRVRFFGAKSEAARAGVLRDFRELFKPSDPAWEQVVVDGFRSLLETLVRRFVDER